MLAQAVQAGTIWKDSPKPQILILKNDLGRRSIEQDLACLATYYGKAEWVEDIFEIEIAIAFLPTSIWSRED